VEEAITRPQRRIGDPASVAETELDDERCVGE